MDYGIIGKKIIFFVLFSLQSISRIISVSSPSNILLTLLLCIESGLLLDDAFLLYDMTI